MTRRQIAAGPFDGLAQLPALTNEAQAYLEVDLYVPPVLSLLGFRQAGAALSQWLQRKR